MSERPHPVFTIGHSNHSLEAFLELLRLHNVTALADVRSAPSSRFNPHFNKEALERSMKTHGIKYVFLGRELGGRPDDRSCYANGRVQYARLARTEVFRSGIGRIMRGAQEHSIGLMCAEKEPLECHRALLVARYLDELGVEVLHILADGRLESHAEAMGRLLGVVGLPHDDLFRTRQELIAEAIVKQEERIAYVDETLANETVREGKMKVFTIGFTKKTARHFFELLRTSGAKRLVDVRLNNVSQLAGFAKKEDLAYFLKVICGMEYIHLPSLAPTQDILDEYKKNRGEWETYESQFLELMRQRRIDQTVAKEMIADGCLLCSEDKPDHCHRRLVAEYLKEHWGDVDIAHLG